MLFKFTQLKIPGNKNNIQCFYAVVCIQYQIPLTRKMTFGQMRRYQFNKFNPCYSDYLPLHFRNSRHDFKRKVPGYVTHYMFQLFPKQYTSYLTYCPRKVITKVVAPLTRLGQKLYFDETSLYINNQSYSCKARTQSQLNKMYM